MSKEKRNIATKLETESKYLTNILDKDDVKSFKKLIPELQDTWMKKQMFRTETEMRFSVLSDNKYPTKAAKYWQSVREQNTHFENLVHLSFDARKNEVEIKKLQRDIKKDQIEKLLKKGFEDSPFYNKEEKPESPFDRPDAREYSDQMEALNDDIFDAIEKKDKQAHLAVLRKYDAIRDKAIESLKLLANQKHFQHSGVCIYKNNECLWEYSETVELKMHDLTEKEIINYVDIENPINAAGAYKFESLGCNLFSYVNGSSHTVRGMPLLPLLNALRDLKIIDLE